MQREPAQEEAQHHGEDDPDRPLGAAPGEPPGLLVDHPVAADDHQEGDEEAHQEAVGGDEAGAGVGVDRQALPLLAKLSCCLSRDF